MKLRIPLLATILATLAPLMITWLYTFTDDSIGPVVLLYPVIFGILLCILWMWHGLTRFCDPLARAAVVLACPLTGLAWAVLCLNGFLAIASWMGESDFQLM